MSPAPSWEFATVSIAYSNDGFASRTVLDSAIAVAKSPAYIEYIA